MVNIIKNWLLFFWQHFQNSLPVDGYQMLAVGFAGLTGLNKKKKCFKSIIYLPQTF
jgi:hypothetical protein